MCQPPSGQDGGGDAAPEVLKAIAAGGAHAVKKALLALGGESAGSGAIDVQASFVVLAA